MWSRLALSFFSRLKSNKLSNNFPHGKEKEKKTRKGKPIWRKQQMCVRTVKHGRTNSANSSMPAPRGDKWEQGPNQMFHQGYRLCSIDRYQPRVCLTSAPYLVALLHPTALSLRTGMSNEDKKLDGRLNEDERENKVRGVISLLSSHLCCHLVKTETYGVRG